MNLIQASQNVQVIGVKFDNASQLETIRRILHIRGYSEDEQWMPDERYSGVIIKPNDTFELSTLPLMVRDEDEVTLTNFINDNK